MDICALIVIHNRSLEDSATAQTLRAPKSVRVFVADNSAEDFGNKALAQRRGYAYINMGGNMGLSRAYNRVISPLHKDDGLICLFDDDTALDGRYFEALEAAAAAHPETDVFAPIVTDEKGMLSPCAISGALCRRVKHAAELPEMGVSAINSGLAVRLKVFAHYRYDEGQFLDYVDHAFIRDVAGNERRRIYVMEDVVLKQRFSGSSRQSRETAMARYEIFKKDVTYFCAKYGIPAWQRTFLLAKRRLRLMACSKGGIKR